jgi:hypothetical protein
MMVEEGDEKRKEERDMKRERERETYRKGGRRGRKGYKERRGDVSIYREEGREIKKEE